MHKTDYGVLRGVGSRDMTTRAVWVGQTLRIIFFPYDISAQRFQMKLEEKYSLESTDPRESEIRAHLRP